MMRKSFTIFVLTVFFSGILGGKLSYFHITESFDTIKLLQGLADLNSTSTCGQHVKELLSDLKSEKDWALLMFDSIAKTPSGFLKGYVVNLGQFDECLEVEHPTRNFTGQHCMLKVSAYYKENQSEVNVLELFPSSEVLDYAETQVYLKDIAFGMCVPSTCTAPDIETGINSMFNKSNSERIFQIAALQDDCETKTKVSKQHYGWTVLGPLSIFILIATLSTIYEVTYKKLRTDGNPKPLFSAFSLYSNGKYLFRITKNSEQLQCLHGIRVLSTFWIVLHHNFWNINNGANRVDTLKFAHDVRHIPISTGFVAVDTFFFLSGMLTSIVFFRDIMKKGFYDVPLGYIHRYIRITPSYAAMIFIVAHVYFYSGDGAMWYSYSYSHANGCKQNWWAALLYVQNFVHPKGTCLGETWYLSVDMQLHWLSPFILYPVFFWSVYAKFIFGAILIVAVSTNFGIAYSYDLGPNLFYTKDMDLQGDVDYYNTHMRAAPYIIGLSTGYLINKIKNEKISIKLNKLRVMAGWFMSTALCLTSLYASIPFATTTRSTLENVLYLALYRVAWGVGLSWIVFACLYGYGGPVNAFLSWSFFQPLSKLSYNVYLVHSTLMFYKMGTARIPHYGSDRDMVFDFFSYLTMSHLLAIPLTLIFEIPFGNLDKYFFRNVKILPIPRKKKKSPDENYIHMSKGGKSRDEETFKQDAEFKSTP